MFWVAVSGAAPLAAAGDDMAELRWATMKAGIVCCEADVEALGSAQPAWAETTLAAKATAVAATVMVCFMMKPSMNRRWRRQPLAPSVLFAAY